jgi:orotidine-5'-phosphate decarboxylase
MKPVSRLVLALDDVSFARAKRIAKVVPDADMIKVNYPLILKDGLKCVRKLSKYKPVICDFKVADIPYTNDLIAEAAFNFEATALIAHSFVGKDSLKACVDVAKKNEGFVIAVVEMTHPGALDFIQSRTDELVKAALEVGVDGFIAPATRPERISHIRSLVGDKLIFSPGIGAQGGSAKAAVDAGADFVIVGRTISQAKDPAAEARKIMAEIGQ